MLWVANLDHGTWLPETLRVAARHSLLYFFKNNNSNVSLDLVVSNDKADQANRSVRRGFGGEGAVKITFLVRFKFSLSLLDSTPIL